MDYVQTMKVFARVAQRSGFAAAAVDLRMSRASVTKHVAALEARVGVRLLQRTTRSVSLTEAGRLYLERCLECLQAFDDADAAVAALTAEPQGRLRVAAPFDFHRHLPSLITPFLKAHPAVELDLRLSNRTLDMVDEGIDVYLRITNSVEVGAIARPLATTRFAVWGARSYFRAHGRPRTPHDLAKHRFVLFDEPPLLDRWIFERGGMKTAITLKPIMVTNGGDALMGAVCSGLGLTVAPSFLLAPEHRRQLEPVLLEWSLGQRRVQAVYRHRRYVPSKIRLFVESLARALGDPQADPWWPS